MTGGRVLVIEDEPGIARMLRRGFALHGLEVIVAEDGAAGRQAWVAGDFDLVVLDVMLPGIDGLELCAERRLAGDRTPVIVLTAREDDTVRDRGMAAGADAYVTKPFAYADLMARVSELLSRSGKPAP